jgi:uncharacterized protein YbaP (TraB family)
MNLNRVATTLLATLLAACANTMAVGATATTSAAPPAAAAPNAASTAKPVAPAGSEIYDPTRPQDAPSVELPAIPTSIVPLRKRIGPAPVPSRTKSFLWEVKSPTGVVWLFGTIHVGKQAFYPLPEAVETAFDQSAKLVVEADTGSTVSDAEMQALIGYAPPDTLDKHIPKRLFDRLKVQLTRLEMPEDAVKSMKPFVVGGLLSVLEFSRLGYDMNLGVDAYLQARSKDAGKPVGELESMTAQLKMMSAMPAALQEDFLENAIAALEQKRAPEQVTGMVNAWQTGDTALMAEVTAEVNRGMKSTDKLNEILLQSRHGAMMKKIEGYLAAKATHFVAVGSLHLIGPQGLIQLLKNKGYEVTQK